MKNKILNFLILSVLVLGMVSAAGGVDFVSPLAGSYVNGESYNVEWTNTASIPGLYLQYAPSPCASGDWEDLQGPLGEAQTNYVWDTTDYSDGSYCLRLVLDSWLYDQENTISVDNENPWVDVHETTPMYPGAKETVSNPVSILINYGDAIDLSPSCNINWDDGSSDSCPASGTPISHQYNDNGVYTVTATVTDAAGNTGTDSIDVSVANVVPTIVSQISGPTDVAVGQAALFTAQANDVVADLNAGLTCNWKFDSSTNVATTADSTGVCLVSHTWTSASTHTVDLCVKDKDNGQNCSFTQFSLSVEAPEQMTPMQHVVANDVFVFDLNSTWETTFTNQFKTSLISPVTCNGVVAPTGMVVSSLGINCQVDWTPSKNQKGENHVIIRVNDGTNHKYYSFDVTVYSWGIHLVPGWNLISIPYVATDSSINAVFADILPNVNYTDSSTATVLQYDAVANKWYKSSPTSTHSGFTWASSTDKLNNIVPGYGYWIKMDNADTLYGIEENFAPGMGPVPSIQLASDAWNLIGRYGANPTNLNPAIAFETLNANWYASGFLKWNGISSWNLATTVDVGNGYWLRTKLPASGQATMHYDPLGYYFD